MSVGARSGGAAWLYAMRACDSGAPWINFPTEEGAKAASTFSWASAVTHIRDRPREPGGHGGHANRNRQCQDFTPVSAMRSCKPAQADHPLRSAGVPLRGSRCDCLSISEGGPTPFRVVPRWSHFAATGQIVPLRGVRHGSGLFSRRFRPFCVAMCCDPLQPDFPWGARGPEFESRRSDNNLRALHKVPVVPRVVPIPSAAPWARCPRSVDYSTSRPLILRRHLDQVRRQSASVPERQLLCGSVDRITGVGLQQLRLRGECASIPLEVAQRRRYRRAHLVIQLGQLSVNANT